MFVRASRCAGENAWFATEALQGTLLGACRPPWRSWCFNIDGSPASFDVGLAAVPTTFMMFFGHPQQGAALNTTPSRIISSRSSREKAGFVIEALQGILLGPYRLPWRFGVSSWRDLSGLAAALTAFVMFFGHARRLTQILVGIISGGNALWDWATENARVNMQ